MMNKAIKTAAIAIIASAFLTGKAVAREPSPVTFHVDLNLGTVSGFPEYYTFRSNITFRGKRYQGMVFPNGLGQLPREGRITKLLVGKRFLGEYNVSKYAQAPGAVFKFAKHRVIRKDQVALIFEIKEAKRTYSAVFFVKFDPSQVDVSHETLIRYFAETISYEYYICTSHIPPINCLAIEP